MERLEASLDEHPEVRLVVIDPVGSFIGGKIDTGKDNEVRATLGPLMVLARKRRIAVLAVMHLNKTEAAKVIYRVAGSVGGS